MKKFGGPRHTTIEPCKTKWAIPDDSISRLRRPVIQKKHSLFHSETIFAKKRYTSIVAGVIYIYIHQVQQYDDCSIGYIIAARVVGLGEA